MIKVAYINSSPLVNSFRILNTPAQCRMNKVNIVVLALTALVVATAATKLITGRSSRWDQMIHDHETRHKRQTGREWRTVDESCDDLGDVTRFDQLGRRNSGILAPVADQGGCGSCWAFAAAHAVSDTRNIAAGRQLDLLSAQYTTRCAAAPIKSGYGCCGGNTVRALRHYRDTGVVTDVCLPYISSSSKPLDGIAKDNFAWKANNALTCFSECADRSNFNPQAITIDGYYATSTYTDDTIINALNNGQAVKASIKTNMDLKQYKCGVLTTTPPALTEKSTHSVTIVDYGSTDTEVDFWVIKNSWGSNRGESGYYRVRRGEGDLGIGRYPIAFPLLSPESTTPSSDFTAENEETCAAEDVTNPQNNDITMSAVDFALQGLVDNQQVQCPNGVAATGLSLVSFDDADVQVVAGMVVELIVQTSLEGCGATVTRRLTLTVFINLDGMFTLTAYNIGDTIENTAKILTASMLLLFAMVMINLVINK